MAFLLRRRAWVRALFCPFFRRCLKNGQNKAPGTFSMGSADYVTHKVWLRNSWTDWSHRHCQWGSSKELRWIRDRDLDHQGIASTQLSLMQRTGRPPRDMKTWKMVNGNDCLHVSFGLMKELNCWKIIVEGGLPSSFSLCDLRSSSN